MRRTDTLEYYGEFGAWVKDRSQAFDFQSTMRALEYCLQSGLVSTEIIMAWGNSALDIVFPCEPRLDVLLPELARKGHLEEHA
ncbi:MAG: hypothetical protein JWM16_5432 [Verrucomicrobiales bacterium]|nr:hypothetical protein [Verrucomicrobiales bacterium]